MISVKLFYWNIYLTSSICNLIEIEFVNDHDLLDRYVQQTDYSNQTKFDVLTIFYTTIFFYARFDLLQKTRYRKSMYVQISFLSQISNHLFLLNSWLIFDVLTKRFFRCFRDFMKTIAFSKCESEWWIINEEIFLNMIDRANVTIALRNYDDKFNAKK